MKLMLIGDDLYYGSFKIATMLPDLIPSLRAEVEDLFHPRQDHPPKAKAKPETTKGTVL